MLPARCKADLSSFWILRSVLDCLALDVTLVPMRRHETIILRCVKSQKSAYLITNILYKTAY